MKYYDEICTELFSVKVLLDLVEFRLGDGFIPNAALDQPLNQNPVRPPLSKDVVKYFLEQAEQFVNNGIKPLEKIYDEQCKHQWKRFI